jgi:hypothetical protein
MRGAGTALVRTSGRGATRFANDSERLGWTVR